MTDWWPITRSKDDVAVEWSPLDGKIRARIRRKGKWCYSKTTKAEYAEMRGRSIVRKEKGK